MLGLKLNHVSKRGPRWSPGFETLRYLTERRLFGYWDGAQTACTCCHWIIFHQLYILNLYGQLDLYPLSDGRSQLYISRDLEATRYSTLALSDHHEIRHASRQQTHRWACHISLRYDSFNTLRAKLFRRNINIYLHFVSFLHIDMTQVLKILPQVRNGPTYSI